MFLQKFYIWQKTNWHFNFLFMKGRKITLNKAVF